MHKVKRLTGSAFNIFRRCPLEGLRRSSSGEIHLSGKSSQHSSQKMASQWPRVLSIQSNVVHGYVGNRSAVFPLQLLGFEVDAVNSVQLSNHTGYPHWKGQVLDGSDLKTLVEGLRANDLIPTYSHLLTGYSRSATFLTEVADLIREVKSANPKAFYVCDPVMGDCGQMYVPEEVLPVYRDQVIPLADILTPNQFEISLLTGMEVNSEEDAMRAMDALHERGIPTIIISSMDLPSDDGKWLTALASTKIVENGRSRIERIKIRVPRLSVSLIGTGDLFGALTLAWYYRLGAADLSGVLERSMATIQAILRTTMANYERVKADYEADPSKKDKWNKSTHWANIELQLVQSRRDIEFPTVEFRAERITP